MHTHKTRQGWRKRHAVIRVMLPLTGSFKGLWLGFSNGRDQSTWVGCSGWIHPGLSMAVRFGAASISIMLKFSFEV